MFPSIIQVPKMIIFFITFFGCCGAIKEHHCMTLSFSVLLALILVIELGAGIASYAFREQVIKEMRESTMADSIDPNKRAAFL